MWLRHTAPLACTPRLGQRTPSVYAGEIGMTGRRTGYALFMRRFVACLTALLALTVAAAVVAAPVAAQDFAACEKRTKTYDGKSETIRLGPKNDKVNGGDGNDKIYGGPGNDILNGGRGKDKVFGGPGKDIV